MERAGAAVAEAILARYPDARSSGSGAARARTAATASSSRASSGKPGGTSARGSSATSRRCRETPSENLRRAREAGVPIDDEPVEPDVVVDALFGTGFNGKPRQEAVEAIRYINDYGRVVAVDLPSGVDASTGEVAGPAVRAAMTVTFHEPKVGLVVAPGRFHAGEVVVADIGLPRLGAGLARVSSGILERVPRRRQDDNKYSAGSVLVVGGSTGKTGAACLGGGGLAPGRRRNLHRLRSGLAQPRLRATPARGHDEAVPGRGRLHDDGRCRRHPRGRRTRGRGRPRSRSRAK